MMFKFRPELLLFLLTGLILPLSAQEDIGIDIQKGNEAYAKKDYYSALVFYSRAMGSQEITDGVIWYKTANSYEVIKGKDPLLDALYTISFYYLIQKQPDHPYTDILKTRINQSLPVNNKLIRKTRMELAGRIADPVPSKEIPSLKSFVDSARGWVLFFRDSGLNKIERMKQPWFDYRKGGIVSGIRSLYQNWEALVLGWVILFFPTGIILPFVIGNIRFSRGKGKGLAEAYLLWFHWGSLGIHRFYLGHYGKGILLLLTLGGLGIGWFVDGLLLAKNFRESAGGLTLHRAAQGGGRSKTKVQTERQVSRRRSGEDTFEDFNLLSSGEEL